MNALILVCDIVEYGRNSFNTGPETYRVTHHLKRVEDHIDNMSCDNHIDEIIKKIALKAREEDRKNRLKSGLSANRRYRLLYCKPEEATHVSLVGIGGAQALLSECKKIGTVKWSNEMIKQERDAAISDFWLGNLKSFYIDWDWE